MLTTAIKIASTAFEHDNDKGGTPYIMHLLYVMHKVKPLGEVAMICAVLHDLIEDKKDEGYTFEYLKEQGFSEEVILILQLLTHRKETQYMDYIKALSVHPTAKAIKKADLEHNTKVSRLKGLRKKDFDRLEKYSIAYQYLND
jgi:(p)ppGpp synthase/HD superfamily hydrolase